MSFRLDSRGWRQGKKCFPRTSVRVDGRGGKTKKKSSFNTQTQALCVSSPLGAAHQAECVLKHCMLTAIFNFNVIYEEVWNWGGRGILMDTKEGIVVAKH